MSVKTENILIQIGIAIAAALFFIPGIGSVHLFDWDEINFAESAREMITSGNYLTVQINFEQFWEKPPLFIWMQVVSMKLFGINEFAARIPDAICGIITLLVLYNIGSKIRDRRFGLLWTMLYACSLLPFMYFKSGIIDPWFNLFIFLGTYYFIVFTDPGNSKNINIKLVASAFFLGLAILTKGPVGLLIFCLTFGVYLITNNFKLNFKWHQAILFLIILGLTGGFWFILQIIDGNFSIIQDFIIYQIRLFETKDAGHGGFPLYHFVILLIGVFPASILSLPAFNYKITKTEKDASFKRFYKWMMILFWVVLILFSIVRTKIIHYSSMCYFPLTFIAAFACERYINGKMVMPKYVKILLIIIACLLGLAVALVTQFDNFKHLLYPYILDEFAIGNMQASATWYGFEFAFSIILIIGVVWMCIKSNKILSYKNLCIMCASCIIFIYSALVFIVPQVEKYSQAAAIEFYESKKAEDCYIYLPYFKSYAQYFYSDRQIKNKNADASYLMHGQLDKDCYFVLKDISSEISIFESEVKDAKLINKKNGFAFYVRKLQID